MAVYSDILVQISSSLETLFRHLKKMGYLCTINLSPMILQ